MSEESEKRPKGCYFDVYGADEEMLKTLTCQNCPLPAMICDFKGYAVLNDIAKRIKAMEELDVVSDP